MSISHTKSARAGIKIYHYALAVQWDDLVISQQSDKTSEHHTGHSSILPTFFNKPLKQQSKNKRTNKTESLRQKDTDIWHTLSIGKGRLFLDLWPPPLLNRQSLPPNTQSLLKQRETICLSSSVMWPAAMHASNGCATKWNTRYRIKENPHQCTYFISQRCKSRVIFVYLIQIPLILQILLTFLKAIFSMFMLHV